MNYQNKPTLTLLLGGFFTGKKIFRKLLRASNPQAVSLSTGVFRSRMSKFDSFATIRHPEKLPTLVDEYYRLILEDSLETLRSGNDLIISEHGECFSTIDTIVSEAKSLGYRVVVWGFFLTREEIQQKINLSKGFKGRAPLPSMAFPIAEGFRRNWKKYVALADSASLVHSGEFPKIIWSEGNTTSKELVEAFDVSIGDAEVIPEVVWHEYHKSQVVYPAPDETGTRYMDGKEYALRTKRFLELVRK